MSRHVTHRGITVDMDSMRRENEKVPAIGNMPVNARGDIIKGGKITKNADDIARERGRVQSVLVSTSLKGPMPDAEMFPVKAPTPVKPIATTTKKVIETELPSGDIVIDGGEIEN